MGVERKRYKAYQLDKTSENSRNSVIIAELGAGGHAEGLPRRSSSCLHSRLVRIWHAGVSGRSDGGGAGGRCNTTECVCVCVCIYLRVGMCECVCVWLCVWVCLCLCGRCRYFCRRLVAEARDLGQNDKTDPRKIREKLAELCEIKRKTNGIQFDSNRNGRGRPDRLDKFDQGKNPVRREVLL